MSNATLPLTRIDAVYQTLMADLQSREPGTRLMPIKTLAARFGVSVFTVQQACARLEGEGFIVRRHGAGTYVADTRPLTPKTDPVIVCMDWAGHVFSDLCRFLVAGMHGLARTAVPLGTENPVLMAQRLRFYAASGAKYFLVHANMHFPFALFDEKCFARKTPICVLEQHGAAAGIDCHAVICDWEAGANMVTDHLWARGHRHLVLTGTSTMVPPAMENDTTIQPYGSAVVRTWRARGGQVTPQIYDFAYGTLDWRHPETVLDCLTGPDAPTAALSLFDTAAFALQKLLLERAPELAGRFDLIGNANTPWSQAGHPPIPSLDWNVEAIAAAASDLIRQLDAREVTTPCRRLIPPRLVLRTADAPSPQ